VPIFFSIPMLRAMVVQEFKGKPGALGELTFWPEVVKDPLFIERIKRNARSNQILHPHCPEDYLVASTRWFTVAHLAFSMKNQPKVISLDLNKKSYYSYRDDLRHFAYCEVIVISEENHFDLTELSQQVDKREVLSYEDPEYQDRPLKIAFGQMRPIEANAGANIGASIKVSYRNLTPQEAMQTEKPLKFRPLYYDTIRKYGRKVFSEGNMDERLIGLVEREGLSIDLSGKYAGYFGTLHAHTGWSDGKGNPELAYQFARDAARLDFFAVTEHPEYWLFENSDRWDQIGKIAEKESTQSFVGIRGFEFSHVLYGHYTVLNSQDYCGANRCANLTSFYNWLSAVQNSNTLAVFNHPGYLKQATRALEHGHYFDVNETLKQRMIGMEVIHWDGYQPFLYGFDGKLPYFDFALSRGWHLAPLGSQDNHSPNWGVAGPNRTVVLLEKLTKENLLEALRKRRFYATTNSNLQFALNASHDDQWYPMGSVLKLSELNGPVKFKVRFFDPDNKYAPRSLEVVKDQKVIAQYVFGQKSKNRPVSTGSSAGEWSFEIPQERFANRSRSYVYVRFYQGQSYEPFTQSSPIYFEN